MTSCIILTYTYDWASDAQCLDGQDDANSGITMKQPHLNLFGRGRSLQVAITIGCQLAFILFGCVFISRDDDQLAYDQI
jgi:hypothetical protein